MDELCNGEATARHHKRHKRHKRHRHKHKHKHKRSIEAKPLSSDIADTVQAVVDGAIALIEDKVISPSEQEHRKHRADDGSKQSHSKSKRDKREKSPDQRRTTDKALREHSKEVPSRRGGGHTAAADTQDVNNHKASDRAASRHQRPEDRECKHESRSDRNRELRSDPPAGRESRDVAAKGSQRDRTPARKRSRERDGVHARERDKLHGRDRERVHSRERDGLHGRSRDAAPVRDWRQWDRSRRPIDSTGRYHDRHHAGYPQPPSTRDNRDGRDSRNVDRSRESERERRARLARDRDGTGRQSPSSHGRDERRKRTNDEPAAVDLDEQQRLLEALEGNPGDEDRLIQQRRARRKAILAKHAEARASAEPTATALAARAAESPAAMRSSAASSPISAAQSPQQPALGSCSTAAMAAAIEPAASAADASLREGSASPRLTDDDSNDERVAGNIWQRRGAGGDEEPPGGASEALVPPRGAAGGESTRGADVDEAAFADEAQKAQEQTQDTRAAGAEFDMFAEEGQDATADMATANNASATASGLADSYDDPDGYYNLQVGEIVNDRYEVFATHGRGVFSSVLRARDHQRKDANGSFQEVAIKVIRANETMHKAGLTERIILRKLAATDPDGKRHIIRMLSHFEFRGHLCLVFESMAMNLRELTRKVARDVGISLPAVQLFAKQMLASLYHLHDCGVLHADIKPDNILINARHNTVKMCDFGSAMFAGDNSVTPYLVSRFYRPPEVILGLSYDYAMDMWSVGCVLFELFTGKILFPGRTNNEMLKLMMDAKGPFPKKMVRKGAFSGKHFDDDPAMSFKLFEEDALTKRIVCRLVSNPKVSADMSKRLHGCYGDKRHKEALADLLEKMLVLDPERRIKPKEALRHPFLRWGQAARPRPTANKAKPAASATGARQ